ncbi:MAG: flagellar basal body P-ring formation protein FlgA [Deltaproteobacteria bacterium]|nr:flagellar basal body P-ring formation protein FlgA [Deltaproteobacteria bacterium]
MMQFNRKQLTLLAAIVGATLALCLSGLQAATLGRVLGSKILVRHVVQECMGTACEIEVGSAPLPGRSRVVSRREVLAALRSAGIGADGLRIPTRRRVVRPARKAGKDELLPLIREAIARVLPDDVILENLGRFGEIRVPRSGYRIEASWPGERSFRRRVSIPVKMIADDVPFLTVQIAATLVLEVRLPVAAGDLQKGLLLDNPAIEWADVRLTTPHRDLARSTSEIIGRRLVRIVAAGEPFRVRDLEKIPVVARGQKLAVESNHGLVRIRTSGIARQDGAMGDRIRIVVPSSSRLLFAEITGPGRAMVVP